MNGFDILYLTHPLNGLLMIALGLLFGYYFVRRFKLPWGLYGLGALTFVLSQVVHLPMNAGLTWLFQQGILPPPPVEWQVVFNAVVLGLTAGLCEETARYIMYRTRAKEARSWQQGLLFGAGHGGIEAIILGVLVLYTFMNLAAVRGTDLTTLVTPDQLALAEAQMNAYWGAAWYDSLLGALERLLTIPAHLAMSLLVLQAVLKKNIGWLLLSIGWHTTLNAVVLIVLANTNGYLAELALAGMTLLSIGWIFWLRGVQPTTTPAAEGEPLDSEPVRPLVLKPVVEQDDSALEESKYN